MNFNYDVIVIGAGHAGCEAAAASAKLGSKTLLITMDMHKIAQMSCNPAIGGIAKGQIVREIDALGGMSGIITDLTAIQYKMLNRSKGPAMWSPRSQADRQKYSEKWREILENTDNLSMWQDSATEFIIETIEGRKKVTGVKTSMGATFTAQSVVLTAGTFLTGLIHCGKTQINAGRISEPASYGLTEQLKELGITTGRMKTGTPVRIDGRTIDFSVMGEQTGEDDFHKFSFLDFKPRPLQQKSCFITYTNEETHEIIRNNIDRSPLFSGAIEGTGPRYCPSIEDKVMKFADKNRHQVFVEPEGEYTNEMYIGGMSSSLPEDVQYAMYRSVPGLENARIVRNAYAIEYDCISALLLKPSLEFKEVEGLYSAGQMNGSSGYEEAAAQGLMAGINAARKMQGKEPVILDRSQAYIGVLIDDLVTKETREPYRMMTSRAEYRLLLRQDNADLRLTDIGHEIGLIDDERYDKFCKKRELINKEVVRLSETMVGANKKVQAFLEENDSTTLKTAASLGDLIKRPELSYELIAPLDEERNSLMEDEFYKDNLTKEVIDQIDIELKYDGYIKRQKSQVEHFKKLEKKRIPADINYEDIHNLRKEARQKLSEIRPENIGQASRISGVSPADISVLMIYLNI